MFLFRFRTERNHNNSRGDNSDGCRKLDTGEKLADIDHSCKYRSIRIAIIVLNIQNNVLNVNKLTLPPDKGRPTKRAEAIPVKIDGATCSIAR